MTTEKRAPRFIYILIPVLLALAYCVDLGHGALDNETDEGRRALVAAEMMVSGNYITPSLQGNIYLNKPPLYNWIIAGSFKMFGNYSMFALRFPVIVSVFIFGFIIYWFVKKYTADFTIAYISAIAFMTNGRILIYDSLQGLIDITFGWVTFLAFMLVYHYGKKEKYLQLFIFTYLLTAAGYMMKGLPAIVCQGFTLLTYFIWTKQFKRLFHWQHFVGIACFLLPLSIYYYFYFSSNNIAPLSVFENLLHESSRRTIIEQGSFNTILHLVTFPFEMMYHFAPWTLLVLALLHKGIRDKLRQNDFIWFNILTLLVNVTVYWTSPQVYARYLFMILPLFINTLVYAFYTLNTVDSWQRKAIDNILLGFVALLAIGAFAIPFIPEIHQLPYLWLKVTGIAVAMGIAAWCMYRFKAQRLLYFALAICIFRFAFNWFVVENRGKGYAELEQRGEKIVQLAQNKPLYILQGAQIGEFLDGLTFHIITRRNQLLTCQPLSDYNALYIADDAQLQGKKYNTLLSFDNYGSAHLQLVQFMP